MARITIKTRDVGPLEFWVPDGGGYVRLESASLHGTLGTQICEGGGTRGNTLMADAERLPAVVRRWNRQRRARIAANGY